MKRLILFSALIASVFVFSSCFEADDPSYDNLGDGAVAGAASSPGQIPPGEASNGTMHNIARMWWHGRVGASSAVGQCINNNGGTRVVWVHNDTPISATADNGAVLNTTMRAQAGEFGPPLAVVFGCKTPGYASPQFGGNVGDPRILLNRDKRWNARKVCTVLAHEIGHQVGYNHDNTGGIRINAVPIPNPGNGFPNWNWGPCGDWFA